MPVPLPDGPHYGQAPFDCQAGLANAHHGWSIAKKQWCCENRRIGCRGPDTPSYVGHPAIAPDCNAGLSNWERGWSYEKKRYCCKHHGKGCVLDHWRYSQWKGSAPSSSCSLLALSTSLALVVLASRPAA
jgi:hypothetical protein